MGYNLAYKILKVHLLSGELGVGQEISIKIDQTITQDATGTMTFLQFETLGISRVKTELSVCYVDHNTLQTGFENADDHRFLQDMAAKYGVYFSRPGNGICHQVHLERFAISGKTMLGADSHTPTAGCLGMLAIGVGGLDVAAAMGGRAFYLDVPKVVNIRLHGRLSHWVSAKDIILEVLRLITVKGGVGRILEYSGEGVSTLSLTERATISNMGAETGATTSLFPSDEKTRLFLRAYGREDAWVPLSADSDAQYDETFDMKLETLEPMVALPHMPDNVVTVDEVKGLKVDQVVIGGCTNSSLHDMIKVASILKGRKIHPQVSLVIAPGSRSILEILGKTGAFSDMVSSGARILECTCGPCIGMGQAPPSRGISVRTYNRNFKGRSGTSDAQVFLVSPETAAVTAIHGVLTNPKILGEQPAISLPVNLLSGDNSMVLPPAATSEVVAITRGPNIKPFPLPQPLLTELKGEVLLKVGDNVTTDHIIPGGAKVLPLRSNIPAISMYAFTPIEPSFPERAKVSKGGFIVGGENYGQGSSREHAALVTMYLKIKAILAKSFARIHRDNLINFGILPLVFTQHNDYDCIDQGDNLEFLHVMECLRVGSPIFIKNLTKGFEFQVTANIRQRQIAIICAGGLLNYLKQNL